ncbi:Nn.00g001300.m01.CDS01 [Neocucurbitaria sp. VM-36]
MTSKIHETSEAQGGLDSTETQSPSQQPYQALIRHRDGKYGEIIPGAYLVTLRPGYTMADQSLAVGTNMEDNVKTIFTNVRPDRVFFLCTDVNDELLTRVRVDMGVEVVECNYKLSIKLE